MTSQIIGNNRLALFLPNEELEDLGLCKKSAQGSEMKKVVVDAMRRLGVECSGDMEIEMFNGKQGILVFAFVGLVSVVRIMAFDDLEDLIAAAGALNELPLKSKVTYCRGKYWLEIKDHNDIADRIALILSEYGRYADADEFLEGILEEYGTVIAENNAIAEFRSAFHNMTR